MKNGLTAGEAERLAMLVEEAGEIVQMVGKILRHGYESYHPSDPNGPTNRELLHRELVDLRAVRSMMQDKGDLAGELGAEVNAAYSRKMQYSHHQAERTRE